MRRVDGDVTPPNIAEYNIGVLLHNTSSLVTKKGASGGGFDEAAMVVEMWWYMASVDDVGGVSRWWQPRFVAAVGGLEMERDEVARDGDEGGVACRLWIAAAPLSENIFDSRKKISAAVVRNSVLDFEREDGRVFRVLCV
nr:hypothetical protein [Tanacetum cinerariifolium]